MVKAKWCDVCMSASVNSCSEKMGTCGGPHCETGAWPGSMGHFPKQSGADKMSGCSDSTDPGRVRISH